MRSSADESDLQRDSLPLKRSGDRVRPQNGRKGAVREGTRNRPRREGDRSYHPGVDARKRPGIFVPSGRSRRQRHLSAYRDCLNLGGNGRQLRKERFARIKNTRRCGLSAGLEKIAARCACRKCEQQYGDGKNAAHSTSLYSVLLEIQVFLENIDPNAEPDRATLGRVLAKKPTTQAVSRRRSAAGNGLSIAR